MPSAPEDDDYYRRFRVYGALGLLLLAGVLMGADAVSVDYSLDTIQLGLVLGSSLAMLAVEGFRAFIR